MFAIFLHESMDPFHQTVTSFPTVLFTFLLLICAFYWFVAALGLIDLDIIDFDMDGDIDMTDSVEMQAGMAGLLLKLGLNGVPFTIVLTVFTVIGWVLSFLVCFYGLEYLPDLFVLEIIFKLGTFFGVFVVSIFTTAIVIRPTRSFFKKMDSNETKHVIGQVAVIRSSIANNKSGEAVLHDGGAGLLLNVRTTGNDEFNKGDLVVVIEYNKERNLYRVVAKTEFSDSV